jgi:hypothetical protein
MVLGLSIAARNCRYTLARQIGTHSRCAILFFPFLVALAVSALRFSPLAGRLALYLAPAFTAAVAIGIVSVAGFQTRASILAPLVLTLSMMKPEPFVFAMNPPRSRREDVQPVLAEVAPLRTKHGAIFAFTGAGPAVSLYAPRHGIDPADLVIGPVTARNTTPTKSLLDSAARRRRVWIVASHDARPQRAELLKYADARGLRLRVISPTGNVDRSPVAFLYDFSR